MPMCLPFQSPGVCLANSWSDSWQILANTVQNSSWTRCGHTSGGDGGCQNVFVLDCETEPCTRQGGRNDQKMCRKAMGSGKANSQNQFQRLREHVGRFSRMMCAHRKSTFNDNHEILTSMVINFECSIWRITQKTGDRMTL